MSELLLTMWNEHLTLIGLNNSRVEYLSVCDREERCGNVYLGRVENKVNNLDAVFVRFEKTSDKSGKHGIGFLPLKSIPVECVVNRQIKNTADIKPGDLVIVQIKTEEQKTKQAKLTSRISLKVDEYDGSVTKLIETASSRCEYQILVDRRKKLIDRIKSAAHELSHFTDDEVRVITDLRDKYDEIFEALSESDIDCSFHDEEEKRISLAVMYSLTSRTEDLLKKKVWLSSGGYLVIEQTETLNLIDVNSGKNLNKSDEFILNINKEAAVEAYRQIRLRNLSGMILIDFISMKDKEQEAGFIGFVEKLIRTDPSNMRFIDMTGLGISEFTRDKNTKTLREMLDLKH